MSVTESSNDWVEHVPLSEFSNKALIIASRFARALRSLNGQKILLQDQQLAKIIVREVSENDDPKLRSLFNELVSELKAFSETRGQARYRGAIHKSSDSKSDKQNVKSTDEKGLMYRGAVVQSEQTSTRNTGKKIYYRGVEVED